MRRILLSRKVTGCFLCEPIRLVLVLKESFFPSPSTQRSTHKFTEGYYVRYLTQVSRSETTPPPTGVLRHTGPKDTTRGEEGVRGGAIPSRPLVGSVPVDNEVTESVGQGLDGSTETRGTTVSESLWVLGSPGPRGPFVSSRNSSAAAASPCTYRYRTFPWKNEKKKKKNVNSLD